MTRGIAFDGLKHAHAEDEPDIDFTLRGYPARDIGGGAKAGQVTIGISGREEDGSCSFDTVVDLELPLARAVAAALVALADYVERGGRDMIRDLLHRYGANLKRSWEHDRLNTLGASETGRCARASAFAKLEVPPDPGFVESWGAALRGTVIEDSFWVPGLRASMPPGVKLLFAGKEQRTLVDGFLSATPDGLLTGLKRDCLADLGIPDIGTDCLLLDCKSIDPRANLRSAKPEHVFQMQVGMGLLRRATEYQPQYALLSYVDASFWDRITEFPVRFDSAIYDAAVGRARAIMTAGEPADLPPEGKIAGGSECRYCAWAEQCAGATVAGIPEKPAGLGANAAAELKSLRDAERKLAASGEDTEKLRAATQEAIKQFLRTAGVRGHRGDDWSVQWTVAKGRQSVDQAALLKAAETAGIKVETFKREGKPAERLTIT